MMSSSYRTLIWALLRRIGTIVSVSRSHLSLYGCSLKSVLYSRQLTCGCRSGEPLKYGLLHGSPSPTTPQAEKQEGQVAIIGTGIPSRPSMLRGHLSCLHSYTSLLLSGGQSDEPAASPATGGYIHHHGFTQYPENGPRRISSKGHLCLTTSEKASSSLPSPVFSKFA